jgi:hypothetical protein
LAKKKKCKKTKKKKKKKKEKKENNDLQTLHIKLKIEQNEPIKTHVLRNGKAVPAPHVTPVVLLLLQTR